MSGQGEPPEGTPDGVPGGGDDEYRSVVFDESFVRAARIQEFSARERLDDAAHAVRVRHVLSHGLARQAGAMILLIMLAFGFAIYMGVRHPYKAHRPAAVAQLRADVISLVPTGPVPTVPASDPFAGGKAAHYKPGAAGIGLPRPHRVGGFARSEVEEALDTAKDYLIASSINRRTVFDGDVSAVLDLLDPGQVDQFNSSLAEPDLDGSHEATGWLVRFEPEAVEPVRDVRVEGSFSVSETSDNQLEVASDHTFVYALRGAAKADTGVSLFTVRRQLRFHFDHEDLRQHHLELVEADVAAGPLACTPTVDRYFRPILAGGSGGAATPANPFDHGQPVGAVCAGLDSTAPHPAPTATGRVPDGAG